MLLSQQPLTYLSRYLSDSASFMWDLRPQGAALSEFRKATVAKMRLRLLPLGEELAVLGDEARERLESELGQE